MSCNTSATVYVTYEGRPEDRFDRSYYVERHLPLVKQAWSRYGLTELTAFFPTPTRVGTLVICECIFRDEADMEAAFGSPETEQVMADIATFTDIFPTRLRVAAALIDSTLSARTTRP